MSLLTIPGRLDLDDLKLPPYRPLEAVEVEDYVDFDGEDSLRVWMILRDDVRDEELADPVISKIKLQIHDYLRARGELRFPYFTFGTASDRNAAQMGDDDEDPDDAA
jgi:isoleucyl-tRNA synthetase